MKFTNESAIRKIENGGGRYNPETKIISIPQNGVGIHTWGAIDFLVRESKGIISVVRNR